MSRTLQMALDAPEPVAYLVEGWHDGKLIAHIPHLTLGDAKASAAVFSQHYTTTKLVPLYAAPAAPVPDALVEAVAKAIYWEWRRDAGYVPWVDGGNSLKQDDARKIARAVVSSAAPVVPLTDEQIWSMWMSSEFRGNGGQADWFCEGIRAAEAHHGITGGKP